MNLCDIDTTNAMYQIGPITERPVFTPVLQIETKDDYEVSPCVMSLVKLFTLQQLSLRQVTNAKKRMQRKMADSDGGVFINNGCNGWSKKEGI